MELKGNWIDMGGGTIRHWQRIGPGGGETLSRLLAPLGVQGTEGEDLDLTCDGLLSLP